MKFLLFSDLHNSKGNTGRGTNDLRKKLLEIEGEKVDEVFFTGDFANAWELLGDEKAKDATDDIKEIAEYFGVMDTKNIHIVMGNHDKYRETDSKVEDLLSDYDREFNYKFKSEEVLKELKSKFGFFEKCAELLDNKIWKDIKNGSIHRYMEYKEFNLVYVNSVIAYLGDNKNDLPLCCSELIDILENIENAKPIIILSHNPIEHFTQEDQRYLSNWLKYNKRHIIWFCGDIHKDSYKLLNNNLSLITCGCLKGEIGVDASIIFGEIKNNTINIKAYSYNFKHQLWEPSLALTKRIMDVIPDKLKNNTVDIPLTKEPTNFFGREKELELIKEGLEKDKVFVISGIGGVGKTYLAKKYAFDNNYKYTFLIDGTNTVTVLNSFNGYFHMEDKLELIDENVIAYVKAWINKNEKCLIIFDNIDSDESEEILLKYYNNLKEHVDVLITTQKERIKIINNNSNHRIVHLGTFTGEDGKQFFKKRTGVPIESENKDYATKISNQLGGLALALEQASAYIINTNITLEEYYNLLLEYDLEVFKEESSQSDFTEKTIHVTFNLALTKITNTSSKELLNIISYLEPMNISEDLLKEVIEYSSFPLKKNIKNSLEFNRVVSELTKYSLVKRDTGNLSIHRLVQSVVKNNLKENRDNKYWISLTDYFNNKFDRYNVYSMFEFTSHMDALLHGVIGLLNDDYLGEEEKLKICELYNYLGIIYNYLGEYDKALENYKKASSIRLKLSGENHILVAGYYNNIGIVYEKKGKYDEALENHKKALSIRIEILGENHPYTADSYNNMGVIYNEKGKYDEALENYKKALSIRIKILGENHPYTAVSYNNIGIVYTDKGKYDEALENHKKALSIRIEILGENHPDTADSYNNMGNVYTNKGKYDEALENYKKALSIRIEILGENHPYTAISYYNIGVAYFDKNDYNIALVNSNKALSIFEKFFPENNEKIVSAKNFISEIINKQEKESI